MPDDEPIGFFDVARNQRACRRFSEDPVSDEVIERCLEAATHAPSAENLQPWIFIVVRDPARRRAIGELCARAWALGGRSHSEGRLAPALFEEVDDFARGGIAGAPVLIVICGDEKVGLSQTLPSSVFPATQNLLLAAAAQGLGSAMTTLATSLAAELSAIVELPEQVRPMAVVPLGHPAAPLGPPRRLPVADKAHRDHYGAPW
jgi:nitroreductase